MLVTRSTERPDMAYILDIEPLDATFGAIVRGVKLAGLDDATWRDIHTAWRQYALLIFPDQHLGRDDQIAFARRFGALELEMLPVWDSMTYPVRSMFEAFNATSFLLSR